MTDAAALAAALLPEGAAAVLAVPCGSALPPRLAAAAGHDRVFAHTPWNAALGRPTTVHTQLAAADRDIPARRATLWPSAGAPLLRRERRIDTLYGDRRVGLIALAGAGIDAAILEGAANVLGRHHPAILLGHDVDPAPIHARLATILPGYTTASLDGLHCLTHGGAVPAATPEPPDPGITVPFDHRLVCEGLHPPEHDNPAGGRWTGTSTATWFLLPRPAPGPWRLRLDIADWGNAAGGFSVRIDDVPHASAQRGAITAAYAPIAVTASDQPLRVRLLLPPALRDMRRGPRRIGVRLLRASLYPAR